MPRVAGSAARGSATGRQVGVTSEAAARPVAGRPAGRSGQRPCRGRGACVEHVGDARRGCAVVRLRIAPMEPATVPPAPPAAPHRRPVVAVLAGAVILVGVVLVGGGLAARPAAVPSAAPVASASSPARRRRPPSVVPTESPPPIGTTADGFLVRPDDLADRAAKAAQGIEPWATARTELIADADNALEEKPNPAVNLDIPGTEGPFVDDTAPRVQPGPGLRPDRRRAVRPGRPRHHHGLGRHDRDAGQRLPRATAAARPR